MSVRVHIYMKIENFSIALVISNICILRNSAVHFMLDSYSKQNVWESNIQCRFARPPQCMWKFLLLCALNASRASLLYPFSSELWNWRKKKLKTNICILKCFSVLIMAVKYVAGSSLRIWTWKLVALQNCVAILIKGQQILSWLPPQSEKLQASSLFYGFAAVLIFSFQIECSEL